MRKSRVLAIALVMSAWAVLPAAADPISDPSAVGQADSTVQAALFDLGGLPFLLTSAPSYVQLPPHHKLRGGGDEDDASSPFIDNFLSSFSFGPLGSGGGSGESGGSNDTGGSGSENTPSGELLGSQSEDQPGGPGDDDVDIGIDVDGSDDRDQNRVPEPSLLLLLGPAGALLLRRRSGR